MNVSKGQGAKLDDLKAAFGTDDQKKICLEVCSPAFTLTFKHIDIVFKQMGFISLLVSGLDRLRHWLSLN